MQTVIPARKTPITKLDVIKSFKRVLTNFLPEHLEVSNKMLACFLAQGALESGNYQNGCWGFNFTNLKASDKYDGYVQYYNCSEIINGQEVFFKPPHFQCRFRAYLNLDDAIIAYLRFLSSERYYPAWEAALDGDPIKFAHQLKVCGFYTASETLYQAGMKRLFESYVKQLDIMDFCD